MSENIETAFVFAGMGMHRVGMGKDLAERYPAARAVFDEADEVLGFPLSKIIFDGPKDVLQQAHNAQPALTVTGIAALRALESETGRKLSEMASYVAGHSLGEYTALCAAGVFTLEEIIPVLRHRGQLMQESIPGGMMAMYAGLEQAALIAQQAATPEQPCEVSNDNAQFQAVLSGHNEAIDRAVAIAKGMGIKATRLPIASPTHSSLMAPIVPEVDADLRRVDMKTPQVRWISNATADVIDDPSPDRIRDLLTYQLTHGVRWRETAEQIVGRAGVMVDCGPSNLLSRMSTLSGHSIQMHAVHTVSGVETFAQSRVNNPIDGAQPSVHHQAAPSAGLAAN